MDERREDERNEDELGWENDRSNSDEGSSDGKHSDETGEESSRRRRESGATFGGGGTSGNELNGQRDERNRTARMDERDPVARAADSSVDLYGVSTWEERSRLDWFSARIYGGLVAAARFGVVLLALAILAAQFVLGGLAAVGRPWIGAFVLLSVVPAFGLAVYIWYADATMSEPLSLLVGTFLLGVLFAGFAAILNTYAQTAFEGIPAIGMVLFFYLVVAPGEETVKLLAVRLYAFRSPKFDAVIDGAVYGAMAGLGFATIENALYISQEFLAANAGTNQFLRAGRTALFRTFAGPGHVIYSAFAGYYLGLAKFNRENAGPIVVKGLLVAAFIHATYNTLAGFVPAIMGELLAIPPTAAFVAFVLVYDGFFGYLLYRKLSNYRRLYREVSESSDGRVQIDD